MLSILMKSLTFLNKGTGKSDCRLYSCVRIIIMNFILGILGVGDLTFGVGYPLPPPLLYETLEGIVRGAVSSVYFPGSILALSN